MKKIVRLKLEGDLYASGCHVTLEIGWEGQPRQMELGGTLPPTPHLCLSLEEWQQSYRQLGLISRIQPGKISYEGSLSDRLKACRQSANLLARHFRTWLNSASFQDLDRRLREELHRHEEIQFLIRTDIPELQKLPWHLWDLVDRYPKAEAALSQVQFEPCLTAEKISDHEVKILAILGHSEGIDIESDRHILESLPHAQITFLVEPQPHQINDQLWDQPWDIIFFTGHSETEKETGRIYINRQDSLTIHDLWYGLRKSVERGLKLAIFNSCDGLGLARALDDLQIPQMIIMRELVPDRIAQEFLKYFLSSFSRGESFYLAVREAREKLQGWEQEFPCATWLPVIYQHPTAIVPAWPQFSEKISPSISKNITDPLYSLPHSWGWKKRAIATIFALGTISISLIICHGIRVRLAKIVSSWAEAQYDDKNMAEARSLSILATKIDPNNPVPYYNLGFLCKEENLPDRQCLEDYEKAADLGMADGQSETAALLIRLGDLHNALKWTGRCIDVLKQQPEKQAPGTQVACYKNRGWIRVKQQRWEEAQEDLETAMAIAIEHQLPSPHTLCLLAEVWEQKENWQQALHYWRKTAADFQQQQDREGESYASREQDECLGKAKIRIQELTLTRNNRD